MPALSTFKTYFNTAGAYREGYVFGRGNFRRGIYATLSMKEKPVNPYIMLSPRWWSWWDGCNRSVSNILGREATIFVRPLCVIW